MTLFGVVHIFYAQSLLTDLAEMSLSKAKKRGLLYHCFEVINLQIRVRNLREDKDMTQKQMADLLCCSQRVYSNYERGEVDIPSKVWVELAKFHGTSVDYLMELTDQKEPYPERKKRKYT